MNFHTFIYNLNDIKQFGSIFNLNQKHLALCLYLTVRRKYYPTLSRGAIIVNRITVTGGDDFEKRLYQNILRLETPIGSYTDGDIIVPNEALALYVNIEPKDTVKALTRTLSRCMEAISDREEIPDAYALYREEISKSEVKGIKYRQIDLDTKDINKVKQVDELITTLEIPILICIETRGGFHIVYKDDITKETKRLLHEFKQNTSFCKLNVEGKMVTDHWFSITSSPRVIMPGTYQGGFPTRIITLNQWLDIQ